ncbi:MAG: hypothetical protein CO035_05050 [Candidatus Omnitrophica bacterium CG_4_9_14_0_2_um_filter_42_8]|nr:MAG: hypothetical protein COW92_05700 [Candidatus Omnitrophica bacterium CG22_combo_CG10-13_8_21_14_all_43_16]PJC48146.1 MAG: hypothetical protein CO035_05050 [Candidatus Omnitrophica bacterium CG_4_9_14_0_2_um_filter_42_8]
MAKRSLLITLILIFGMAVIFLVQFSTPCLYDADGYLHIRMAEFLKDLGPRYNFHWARFSTFNGNFSDKDFLYHAALIPFTFFKDIFLGAKVAAFMSAAALFLGFYLMLRKYADEKIIPFMLLGFLFSANFLETINSPRPIALVILLNLWIIHLLIQRKYLWLFLAGIAYSLMHVTSPLAICYAVIIECVRRADRKEFSLKNIFVIFFGVLAGFLIHPNFPNNFLVFYLNSILVPIYTIKTGVLELGAEFFPLNTREYLLGYPVVIMAIIIMIRIAVSKVIKPRFETKAFLTLGMVFLVLSFISQRYLSHGYLIMLIALACYISDSSLVNDNLKKSQVIFMVILFLLLGLNSYNGIKYKALVSKVINGHYEAAGKWMAKNIPEKELIFHANWSDSQYFIGLNPKDDYFVTLDPVYMYNKNPELYKIYRDVSFGRTMDPYAVLKDTFKVKYGYAGKNYFNGLVEQIRKDSRFIILAEDQFGVIFERK